MEQRFIDEMYMRRCLQLARCGRLGAAPNPMVGAVVVCDGRIIGEGYHRRCGEAHAEVNAIASVAEPRLLSRSTIYVSLEPCAHYGKTPPCAQLIIDKKIPTVVVGCRDPFARVDGRGIAMLREAGVEVREGVLEAECLWLNRRFITFHTLHRPYITLKWAQSEDGFIDRRRTSAEEPPVHFSTPVTQALVHQLRAENEAVLVGRRTWELDRPRLDVRLWHGRSPMAVVLSGGRGFVGCDNIATHGTEGGKDGTRGRTGESEDKNQGETQGKTGGTEDKSQSRAEGKTGRTGQAEQGTRPVLWATGLQGLMDELCRRGVQSLLVEGGAQTLQSFIDSGLWDEARIETAPLLLNDGIAAPRIEGEMVRTDEIDGNIIRFIQKKS